jgi:RNA polymerase sigma factor (sigma-70 family)
VLYVGYFLLRALGDLDGFLSRENAEEFLGGPVDRRVDPTAPGAARVSRRKQGQWSRRRASRHADNVEDRGDCRLIGDQFPQTLAAARTGAEWAWAAVYRELSPSVLGYLRARGAADPEDLTGEVFLQVVRDLGRFAGDERDFRAWVFVIAHHRLIDERRMRGRRPVETGADMPETAHQSGNVEDEAIEALGSERVRRIIGQLPADQRDVLLLRVMGGLTVAEVAQAVGRSQGAVKALQRRGLARIQQALGREGVTL